MASSHHPPGKAGRQAGGVGDREQSGGGVANACRPKEQLTLKMQWQLNIITSRMALHYTGT